MYHDKPVRVPGYEEERKSDLAKMVHGRYPFNAELNSDKKNFDDTFGSPEPQEAV